METYKLKYIECQLGAFGHEFIALLPISKTPEKGLILAKLRNGALAQWSVVYV